MNSALPNGNSPSGAGIQPYRAAFERIGGRSDSRLVLVVDHATNAIPPAYGTLGLGPASLGRHIAYDIGAAALARELAKSLGAGAVIAGFSRLFIDANRGEDDPTLIMQLSDGEIVPGNRHIDRAERERRLDDHYRPYHRAIDEALDGVIARGLAPVIISLHSFTPVWRGRTRPWHCGVLWHGDAATAGHLLKSLRAIDGLIVGDNEPYSGWLEGDCMDKHGAARGIAHGLIEVRQDLLCDAAGIETWARRLEPILVGLTAKAAS